MPRCPTGADIVGGKTLPSGGSLKDWSSSAQLYNLGRPVISSGTCPTFCSSQMVSTKMHMRLR